MIYIDPPYNTGSANFVYADNFRVKEAELIKRFSIDEEAVNFFESMFGTQTHSGWLFAMYPRLKLARDLLTDDGAIFISIDDKESANLKIMCDEIFGEAHYLGTFVWETKRAARGVPPTTMLMHNHEYVLAYSKGNFIFNGERRNEEDFSNPDNDPRGLWRSESMRGTGAPKDAFAITDPKTGNLFTGNWAFSESTVQDMLKNGLILFPSSSEGTPRQKKFINSYRNKTKAIITHLGWFSTETATKKFMSLFGQEKIFDFPKPVDLIKFFVKQSTDNSDIILDFFAGSGTTAHAVIQLNAEDGGNRKFILAQWDETIDQKSSPQAHKFCIDNQFKPVISSITIERVKRAGEKVKEENGSLTSDLDIGYKVFSLTDRPVLEKTADGKYQSKFSEGTEVLYNMMTASGEVLLTAPFEVIEENLLYKVGNSYFVLGECKTSLEQFSSNRIYINGYANIHLERWLNMLGLNKDNIKVLYY